MRFMVLVKANKDSEAGVLPDEKLLTEMGKFNEELVKAGVMLAGEGLQPSSKGVRVARPSCSVFIVGYGSRLRLRHACHIAGAASDCTAMTRTFGFRYLATMQFPDAQLPPPAGAIMTSTFARSSNISSAIVPTPAISDGSLAEWT